MKFFKYHALGNDYIVLNPGRLGSPHDIKAQLTTLVVEFTAAVEFTAQIQLICDRHYGVGSDGLLLGPLAAPGADFGLRLFNPDGGEFEKSGNGLRIFCRYLWDMGLVQAEPFTVWTPGGVVRAQVHEGGTGVTVEMGTVSFDSARIPVNGPPRQVLNEQMVVDGQTLTFCAATIGNPHCVVLRERALKEEALHWGPLVETDPRFPNRTNVQFMQVLDRANIQIEIWERGVGYTLASGTSSCAAAAAAYRLGCCDSPIAVHMPGGVLHIAIAPDLAVSMTGPVTRVCEGSIAEEMFCVKR